MPVNRLCGKCGALAWHWDGQWLCGSCRVPYPEYIGLVSPQGMKELNARFALGYGAELLENGKWYTNQELLELCGSALLFGDSSGSMEKNVTKWRCVRSGTPRSKIDKTEEKSTHQGSLSGG